MNIVRNAIFIAIMAIIMAAACLAGSLAVGGLTGFYAGTVTVEPQVVEDARTEYYRGVYDICLRQTGRIPYCLEIVREISEEAWYEKPSLGWEWPLATVNGKVAEAN